MPIKFDSFPLRAVRKGRKLAWDPHAVDFSKDPLDWNGLNQDERDFLLRQVIGFLVGERGVTHDLAPLQQVLRRERGHMEEEMYLTQQLAEESSHVEFFQRWIDETLDGVLGADIPYPRGSGNLFSEVLPRAMQALNTDPSPSCQMRALVVYHQIIEGVLAEVGYDVFYHILDTRKIMPGLRQGVRFIQQDEARHIAFGTYLCKRLIAEHPETEQVFYEEMEKHHDMAINSPEGFLEYHSEPLPFGIEVAHSKKLSESLYQRRIRAVTRETLAEV